MDAGPNGKRKEFILVGQNFRIALIRSMLREKCTVVSLMNFVIPKGSQSTLKQEDNPVTQVVQSSVMFGQDLAGLVVGRTSCPTSKLSKKVEKTGI